MKVKLSDLCMTVAAIAIGARLSRLFAEPVPWPFDNFLLRAVFLGCVTLCPLTLLKHFVLDRRRIRPRLGEWLWIVFCSWFAAVLLSSRFGSEDLAGFLVFCVGLLINPLLFFGACANLIVLSKRGAGDPADWCDAVGCFFTALLSFGTICFYFHIPPI
jgi:hypothetical protein